MNILASYVEQHYDEVGYKEFYRKIFVKWTNKLYPDQKTAKRYLAYMKKKLTVIIK